VGMSIQIKGLKSLPTHIPELRVLPHKWDVAIIIKIKKNKNNYDN
jgi:hypothetical protein